MIGVTLVQMQSLDSKKSVGDNKSTGDPWIGLLAVLTACFSSGFAGVYYEKQLKSSSSNSMSNNSKLRSSGLDDVWTRNIQLGIFGCIFSLIACIYNDGAQILEYGFFSGYSFLIWLVVCNQAFGGLVVAVVVKYADNILKGFASSTSILLSGTISWALWGFTPDMWFIMGGMIVMIAVYMYARPQGPN